MDLYDLAEELERLAQEAAVREPTVRQVHRESSDPASWVHLEEMVNGNPWTLLRHLLHCARSNRHGPLVEHWRRITHASEHELTLHALQTGPLGQWLHWTLLTQAGQRTWRWSLTGTQRDPVGKPHERIPHLPWHALGNLQANAEREGIIIAWGDASDTKYLGYARRPPRPEGLRRRPRQAPFLERHDQPQAVGVGAYQVYLDIEQLTVSWSELILHELAHILLGHIGRSPHRPTNTLVPDDRWQLPTPVREFEVALTVYVTEHRLGTRAARSRELVCRWYRFLRLFGPRAFRATETLRILAVSEILINWCRQRPPAVAAREPRDAPNLGQVLARRRTAKQYVR